jgi:hypothetical protein
VNFSTYLQHFNQLAKDNNLDNALKTNGGEGENNTMSFE